MAKGFTSKIVHFQFKQDNQNNHASYGSIHTPIYNSVPYGYQKVEDIIDVFQGKSKGHAYARQSTPTTDSLQNLLAMLDDSIGSLTFATGMAAISATFLSLLKQGDHIICSQYLFGNSYSFFTTLENFGINVSFVDTSRVDAVKTATTKQTKIVFVETLANPGTQIPDLENIGQFCQENGLLYIVDNTMTSSYLFSAKSVNAHLIITSLSKYTSGHGNVLGGAVSDTGLFNWETYPHIFENYRTGNSQSWGLQQIKKKSLRDMGGTLSSDSAYQIALASETMALRMDRQCDSANKLAAFLDSHPKIKKVYHPSLKTHEQHEFAKKHFKHFGAILSFDLEDDVDVIKVLNKLDIAINATHLGDNRTLILPMAQTIFYEMGPENRKKMNIGDKMIRCTIGIEDTQDLIDDFTQALKD
ncbi:cystathionine gamma-synthase family protein [Marinicellulosiphila megalodicopiae]|uniref:cystathionine gamma-synthase family protein n=1 Tax=Marinicellulosiphila megalodicopiae TaxID=2724896 RepID=UPI003BAE816B